MAKKQQQQQTQNLESESQGMSVDQVKDLLAQAKDNPAMMQQLATNPQAMGAIMQNAPQIAMSWLDGFRPRSLGDWLTLPIRLASLVDGFVRTENTNIFSRFGVGALRLVGVDKAADWVIEKHTDLIADKAGTIANQAFNFVKSNSGIPKLDEVGTIDFKLDRDKVRSLLIAGGWISNIHEFSDSISDRIIGAIDMTPAGALMNNDASGALRQRVGGIFSNRPLASTLVFGLVAANAFQKEIESAFPVAKGIFKATKPIMNALPGGVEDQLKNLQKGVSEGEFHQICQTYFVDGDRLKSASEVAGSMKFHNIVETTKLAMALEKIQESEGYIALGETAVKLPREITSLVSTLSKFSSSLHTGPQLSEKSKANPKILQAKLKDYVEEMIETSNRLINSYPALASTLPKLIENGIGVGDEIKAAIIQGLNDAPEIQQRSQAEGTPNESETEYKPQKAPREALKEAAPDEFLALLRSISGGTVSAPLLQHPVVRSAENVESKFLLDVITLLDTAADNKDPIDKAKQQAAVLAQAVKGDGAALLTPQRVSAIFNMLGPSRLDQRIIDIPKAMALGGTFADAVASVEESLRGGNRQQVSLEYLSLGDAKGQTIH